MGTSLWEEPDIEEPRCSGPEAQGEEDDQCPAGFLQFLRHPCHF